MARNILFLMMCAFLASCATISPSSDSPVKDKIILLDPGHGGTADTDHFRVGPAGEREEWINLRVAKLLRDMLRQRGATVVMTREEDVAVPLKDRADLARSSSADVFLSIHHNATADRSVNFPIVYYHAYGSGNQAGVELARHVAREINAALFDGKVQPSVCSDYVIFPTAGTAVLRHSYGIPGVIGEASFFSNASEEQRLIDPQYNRREAEAYVRALEAYFSDVQKRVLPKEEVEPIPPFEAFQEAERMNEEATRWRGNFEEGRRLLEQGGDLQRAYDLLTISARSFPDSSVADDCHRLRARILRSWGRTGEARQEERRAEEFYAPSQ